MRAGAGFAGLLITLCLLISGQVCAAQYPQNPLPDGESVYVSHQGVYRFDGNDPQPVWSSLQGVATFAPVAYRELLLVGSSQGLYALRQADGSVAWHIEKHRTLFTPIVADHAYAGSVHGELYAIRPRDGGIVWRRTFDGWIYSPAVSDQAKLLWTGGQPHAVYALNSVDGKILRELATTQEAVFGAVDLGDGQAAFNLFDGNTAIVGFDSLQIDAILDGDSQPTGVRRLQGLIYRSHSDGSLSAFARGSLQQRWRRPLAAQNLVMHPSLPGYLLLGDGDRKLFLLDLAADNRLCELESDGPWLLPILQQTGRITFFRKSMQPPRLTRVKSLATCQ